MPHILCVEDNEDANALMDFILRKEGRFVTAVPTQIEAKALIEKINYDLYILDGGLDTSDGFDLCRLIRQKDMDVPIIVYSGRSSEQDQKRGLEAGATVYLTKPEGIHVIAGTVEKFLSNNREHLGAISSIDGLVREK